MLLAAPGERDDRSREARDEAKQCGAASTIFGRAEAAAASAPR